MTDLNPSSEVHFEEGVSVAGSNLGGGETTSQASRIPLYISVFAVAIAISNTFLMLINKPLGQGVSSYDLTTPQKAVDSYLAMEVNGDLQAILDVQRLKNRHAGEKRETLKLHRDADYQGKKILFVSFKENGITKYETETLEKDAESGLWLESYVPTYSMSDPALEKSIKEWVNKTDEEPK